MKILSAALFGFVALGLVSVTDGKGFKLPVTRMPKRRNKFFYTSQQGSKHAGDVPMGGNFLKDGEYYVNLTIGKQHFNLQLDTGSSDVGVWSTPCEGCEKKIENKPYKPQKSPTAEPLGCNWCEDHEGSMTKSSCKKVNGHGHEKQCTIDMRYYDESGWSAALWSDTVSFGPGLKTNNSVVGAIYRAKFPNPDNVDGIIGFASKVISSSGAYTPVDDLVMQGVIEDVFALCLHDKGGHLYLGEEGPAGERFYGMEDDIQWTPRLSKDGFYALLIEDIKVDGVSMGITPQAFNAGNAIVDSGTSFILFPSTGYAAFKAHVSAMCFRDDICFAGLCDCDLHRPLAHSIFEGACVEMSEREKRAWPTLEFTFDGGAKVPLGPDDYLNGLDCPKGMYMLSISECDDGDGTTLGDTFMRSSLVVHDRREPQRIGFAPISGRNCP